MRALFIFLLLATAIAGIQTTAAEDICPDGIISGGSYNMSVPGVGYTANNCTFENEFVISGEAIPSSVVAVTVTVENSVVNENAVLLLRGVSASTEAAPLMVTIKNSFFRLNAIFCLNNKLPRNSILTFQNNIMSADTPNSIVDSSFISLIYLTGLGTFLNSTINIFDNYLSVSGDGPIQVMHTFNINLHNKSAFNIRRNKVTVNGTVSGAMWYFSNQYIQSNASLCIEENQMTSMSSSIVEVLNIESIYGDKSGVVSFSDNIVNVKSAQTEGAVVRLYYLESLNVQINKNDVSYNYSRFLFSRKFHEPTLVSIKGNDLKFTAELTNESITSPVMLINQFEFANSTAVIASNKVTATSEGSIDSLLLQVSGVYNFVGSATIIHCGNSLSWSPTATPDQLFSTDLLSVLIFISEACEVETSTPPETENTSQSWLETTALSEIETTATSEVPATTIQMETPGASFATLQLGHSALLCVFIVFVVASL